MYIIYRHVYKKISRDKGLNPQTRSVYMSDDYILYNVYTVDSRWFEIQGTELKIRINESELLREKKRFVLKRVEMF